MKSFLPPVIFLALSSFAFCGPASLAKATSEFRVLFNSVMSADSSNPARREELRLKLEVQAVDRCATLLHAMWAQARRRRAEHAKVEENRQSSLTYLNDIETGVRSLWEAADKTKLPLPKERIRESAGEIFRLIEIYRDKLSVERFPAEEAPSR